MSTANNLDRSISQVIEWTFGATHMDFGVLEVAFAKIGEEADYGYRVSTNIIRIDRIKHPLALVVTSLQLSLHGTCLDPTNLLKTRGKEKVIPMELEELRHFELTQDQGGYSTIGVQHLMGLHDGGEKSLTRQFMFRHDLLHAIR